MLNNVVDRELELPGEPMIYSVKYPVGQRTRGVQFFRNMKWKSLLKSFFRSFYRTNIACVLIVRFFVTPPENVTVSAKVLRQESLPAVMSFELCEYTLSFLEMLHHVLFNSYRQVVKIDVEKYYSDNPRTVMKFMKWDEYVKLQNNNTHNPETESVSEAREMGKLQSKCKGNETSSRSCEEEVSRETDADTERACASDSAFRSTSPIKLTAKKKRSAKLPTSHKETGWRQPGEIS